ncbi:hypothetical protein [Ochrobactrum sp. BTU1]|uniref:hypothetical protein n=1 Tax=Ochrobactrum sp. BTU1 TaxID=2840456 RepID=UPI001C055050|nr:hypothetical protein KMS41_14120 [Ochrobactrum sp. BTU1]
MPRTTAPVNGKATSNDPLEVAREAFFELDDAFGRLDAAIRVMDMLTEDLPQNLGTVALHDKHREIANILRAAWPVVVGRPA